MAKKNWAEAMKPLVDKYSKRPHPLEFRDLYQLMVMVILSAQDSDRHINAVAPPFFEAYPDLASLVGVREEALLPYLGKVRGHRKKISWIVKIANTLKENANIPVTMDGLTALPGIGRKSANVIMREMHQPAEGIVVDLHVVRVAPRLGITRSADPKKIEEDLMRELPRDMWGEAGMAISFLGREVCRPTHPEHHECVMREHCEYYHQQGGKVSAKPSAAAKKIGGNKRPASRLSAQAKKAAVKKPVKKSAAKKKTGKSRS
jgi:endonuclease III